MSNDARLRIAVLVPTWKRPVDLDRCLAALARQTRAPDRCVVVWREGDDEVHGVLERWKAALPLQPVEVRELGVVQAMNAGLAVVEEDVVAITDDDGAPHPDWLSRIEALYRDHPGAVAVGGRDLVHVHGIVLPATTHRVGTLSWFGRSVGSHHEGLGTLRRVDFLKGVNCSFLRSATDGRVFDRTLLGKGAQWHWEMAFFLPLRRKGAILYDPDLLVDHHPAPRHDEDQRDTFNRLATFNAGYNETKVLLENLPVYARFAFFPWAVLVGTSAHPGLLQGVRLALRGTHPKVAFGRTLATCQGRFAALGRFLSTPTETAA